MAKTYLYLNFLNLIYVCPSKCSDLYVKCIITLLGYINYQLNHYPTKYEKNSEWNFNAVFMTEMYKSIVWCTKFYKI